MARPRFISPERSSQLSSADPRWRLKVGLHTAISILAFISITLFAAAIPQWNKNFFHSKGSTRGDWTDGMSIGPLAFTMMFSLIAIINFFIRRKPVPPKVCTITFALILLSLAPSLFLAGHGSLFRHWRASAVRNQNGVLVCNLLNVFSRECEPILYSIGELQIAGIVFGSLVWVSIFVLLLVSVYETRAEKMQKPRLPRRLTLAIADLEKGYRRARDRERDPRPHHSRPNNHRQRGTKQHYRVSNHDEQSDTIPIFYVQEPLATHPPRNHRYS